MAHIDSKSLVEWSWRIDFTWVVKVIYKVDVLARREYDHSRAHVCLNLFHATILMAA